MNAHHRPQREQASARCISPRTLGAIALATRRAATALARRPPSSLLVAGVLWARIAAADCGDGVVEAGETCDDGNLVAGDCCASTCTTEPAGSGCVDDGNPCSLDQCDGSGTCTHPTGGTAPCDDGDACTTGDVCADGVCAGTAVLVGCVDAALCHRARPTARFGDFLVGLDDGVARFLTTVKRPLDLCLPASTTGAALVDPAIALMSTIIKTGAAPALGAWQVTDQFGTVVIETRGPEELLVASATSSVAPAPAPPAPGSANHYVCRRARLGRGASAPPATVTIDDALGSRTAVLRKPRRLCLPADIDAPGTGREHPRSALLCYTTRLTGPASPAAPVTVETANHLGTVGLAAWRERQLCVPAAAQDLLVRACVTSGDECGLPCCREYPGQRPDCTYDPVVSDPRHRGCSGPTILFDSTHANFHQVTPESARDPGRFWGFAKLLARDGYPVRDSTVPFTTLLPLAAGSILAIANPRPLIGGEAIPAADVTALVTWVDQGGSLLLSIDHPPFEKTDALLAAFGLVQLGRGARRFTFTVANGGLNAGSPIASGISEVSTFTGTAFSISATPPPQASYEPVLTYPPDSPQNLDGWLQGVAIQFGAGRVYVSGESGGLTAQSSFGMQETPDNEQFVRNIIHWLDD